MNHSKHFAAILLAVVLCALLCGCGIGDILTNSGGNLPEQQGQKIIEKIVEDSRQAGSETIAVPPADPTPVQTVLPEETQKRSSNPYYAERLSSTVVIVDDRAHIWPDSAGMPFSKSADRISSYANNVKCSLVAVTSSGSDGSTYRDFCVNYLNGLKNDSRYNLLWDQGGIFVLFDASYNDYYVTPFGNAVGRYDVGTLQRIVNYNRNDYEAAAIAALQNKEPPTQNLLPSDTTKQPQPSIQRPPVTPVRPQPTGYYILPQSGSVLLTERDLWGLTWEECTLARNEIYARHGRIFKTKAIAAYFGAQSWYHGTIDGAKFDAAVKSYLSSTERKNAEMILAYEKKTWGGSYY